MEFKKLTSELERLKELNLRGELTENGKEIIAELEEALSICEVNRSLPTDTEIILDIEANVKKLELDDSVIYIDLEFEAYKLGFKKSQEQI